MNAQKSNSYIRGHSRPNRGSVQNNDSVGNRKTFREVRIPPDNIGNQSVEDPEISQSLDTLGNSVDGEPTHVQSGILMSLLTTKNRDYSRAGNKNNDKRKVRAKTSYASSQPKKRVLSENKSQSYMEKLSRDFSLLLRNQDGQAFNFTLKPIDDVPLDMLKENRNIEVINKIVDNILRNNDIEASLRIERYQNALHSFVVFFIEPEGKDPQENKALISALRKVIQDYADKKLICQSNIFLVLANAQSVIEKHLFKLGARKESKTELLS